MLIPSAANVQITPAMLAVLWGMADELDRRRISATIGDAVWLEIPSKRLRDPDGRNDNFWLRECLDRLTGIKLNGEYRGDPWGAVVLAEWHLTQGGSMCRLLVPPAAIHAIRAPATFAKIEITAAYKLKGHARRLYAALADKKRMGQPHWTFTLEELRRIFDLEGRYETWADLRRYVLAPALDEINDYGTVAVSYSLARSGRAVAGIRFDWQWKTVDEARETDEENERHGSARRKSELERDAPPLYQKEGTPEQRKSIADKIMRDAGLRR